MLVSGTEYLDLDRIERDFCSTRQDYSQFQLEVVVEKISTATLNPNRYLEYEVSHWGVVRGNTETTHTGQLT